MGESDAAKTAAREFKEEVANLLPPAVYSVLTGPHVPHVYLPQGKYVLYLPRLTRRFDALDKLPERFKGLRHKPVGVEAESLHWVDWETLLEQSGASRSALHDPSGLSISNFMFKCLEDRILRDEVQRVCGLKELKVHPSMMQLNEAESEGKTGHHTILVPTVFSGAGKVGDFGWMIRRPEYARHFFIFNDNEHQYRCNDLTAGLGNAVIRPYKDGNPPRAWGIPTGDSRGGYHRLSE